METLAVVKDFDVVEESALGVGAVSEGFAFEIQFAFEGGPEAFHRGVIVAAAGPAHAGGKAKGEELLLVGGAGVLAAAIGMVEEAGFGAAGLLSVGQSLEGQGSLQVIMEAPADDFAAEQVHESGEVKPALAGAQVSDISDPDLVGALWRRQGSQ